MTFFYNNNFLIISKSDAGKDKEIEKGKITSITLMGKVEK